MQRPSNSLLTVDGFGRTSRLVLCGLILAITSSCQTTTNLSSIGDPVDRYSGWGFSILLPPNCEVLASEMVDYNIYFVIDKTTEVKLLVIFATLHPNFPKGIPATAEMTSGRVQGRKAKFARWRESGLACAEVLIKLHSERDFDPQNVMPTFLHCVYSALEPNDVLRAESIIKSIAPL